MASLFPDGLHLKSEDEFAMFRLFDRVVGSITHFAQTGMAHRTSVRDISTYAALIEDVLSGEKEK